MEEKSNLKKSEESTEDVDAQLRILREERTMLTSARGPGSTANLTDAFNDAAQDVVATIVLFELYCLLDCGALTLEK